MFVLREHDARILLLYLVLDFLSLAKFNPFKNSMLIQLLEWTVEENDMIRSFSISTPIQWSLISKIYKQYAFRHMRFHIHFDNTLLKLEQKSMYNSLCIH